jgi:hydrogenase-4 component B
MGEQLILLGTLLLAVSGVPGLFLSQKSTTGQHIANLFVLAGAGLGLTGIGDFLLTGESQGFALPWSVPGGEFTITMDGLSAVFLLPVLLISLLGSIYGLEYWKQTEHPHNGSKLRFFYGLLAAGMTLLVISENAILFLFAWEVMALAAFFLITTEDEDKAVREAGWIYLVATHTGTLCLFGVFALLRSATGSFDLTALAAGAISPELATAIFLLAVVGFGLKAGIMPLHVWLPGAHANAPSHISALLSGVLIKMGIYGIVRISSFFPDPPVWWGGMMLALGVVSGVLGVVFAIGQHDFKRLLAYHSIENIGIIVMGLGLALLGRSLGQREWMILGLSGALLHVWNHALFKALLFLSAGSVIHAVHTREIDHLGGLAKAMPYTALCFLIGAVAICGLPPLNGFVSELLIYLGLFQTLGMNGGPSESSAAFAVPALALIGGLAVACFVKVYGAVFLGVSRSEHADHAHECGLSMLAPMGVLAACCIGIGLAPVLVAPVVEKAVLSWATQAGPVTPQLASLAPLGWISTTGVILIALLLGAAVILQTRLRRNGVAMGPTWGCGYALPSSRMQYTSSSFAQMLVGLFHWALRPQGEQPQLQGLFPTKTRFHTEVPDTVLHGVILPAFRCGAWLSSQFRVLHPGMIQLYVLYIIGILLLLFAWI